MDLIIFIVFEVQANNNFISSSLFSSSLFIIHFSHSSQLDNIVPGPLYNCLDFKLKFCNQKYGSASTDFPHCYINGFVKCLSKHHEHSTPDEEKIYLNAKRCLTKCFRESKDSNLHMANCLLEYFGDSIKL